MRTPRIVILVAFFVASFTLLVLSLQSPSIPKEAAASKSKSKNNGVLGSFFFSAPLSLFPPNAIISLTDDNTTSFLARPAAFGPLLPPRGLSGQLWIGSGFGDDTIRQGIISTGVEGELGCSDVPGWSDGNKNSGQPSQNGKKLAASKAHSKRSVAGTGSAVDKYSSAGHADDGTDDYLHNPLSVASLAKGAKPGQQSDNVVSLDTDHADIQSIQEGAEIAGKVVLLSRGGCGFLEKVKWAQRRGGIAVIVGDDTRGGPLIQMYARGDTSNVTIPSVFTSHTTAHLLSSLIPAGTYIEDTTDENGNSVLRVQRPKKSQKKGKKVSKTAKGPTTSAPKVNAIPPKKAAETSASEESQGSWFSRLFSGSKSGTPAKKGVLDWVLVDDWDENEDFGKVVPAKTVKGEHTSKDPSKNKGSSKATADDGFVIGVHDWRDPDLVNNPVVKDTSKASKTTPKGTEKGNSKSPVERDTAPTQDIQGKKSTTTNVAKPNGDFRGGSITPGSGEYVDGVPAAQRSDDKASKKQTSSTTGTESEKSSLLTTIFGDDDDNDFNEPPMDEEDDEDDSLGYNDGHEGLWVTLIQANGVTPFFDTLLVLVISPLVTLTVVYALLLLRSRIRRRRWRAPKSVVERLPVRTYHTVTSPSGSQSRQPSPTSSSPTTPLLQSRPRPRSRTTSGLPEPGNLSRSNSSNLETPRPIGKEHEKHVASEWKKYMGRQVECVVCLEEYVDGVSRVMSLPCGHEFHVDCM